MKTRRAFLQSTVCALAAVGNSRAVQASRLAGITVLPEFVQSEGADAVLKNLIERAGSNAVTTSPYVMEVADDRTGGREPPIDAGAGSVRKLDRDLFGKRELWVRTAPAFTPKVSRYQGLRYQPPSPDELTKREGHKVRAFVKQAKAAGLRVFLQVQAASPPGYRVQFSGVQDEDQPRLLDGTVPPQRVDKNGSLASPHIIAYTQAMLCDLAEQYPEIDGFRIDWPEYPPYFLDALFVDYSVHAEAAAKRLGVDWAGMCKGVAEIQRKLLGGLTNDDLKRALDAPGELITLAPALRMSLDFRAQLVAELLKQLRQKLDAEGFKHVALVPNAFPPPWNLVSGFHFDRVHQHIAGMSVKFYAMHWAMMLRFYGDAMLKANPSVDESLLTRVLVKALDLADDEGLPHLVDYHYPEPDEAHPCGTEAIKRKLRDAQKQAGTVPVYALAHGYGPVEDFRRRLMAANEASQHGFWINRYGYLSDDKLSIVREVAG